MLTIIFQRIIIIIAIALLLQKQWKAFHYCDITKMFKSWIMHLNVYNITAEVKYISIFWND